MRWRHAAVAALIAGFATSLAGPADAQTWSDAQLEVWEFIQGQWDASMEEDATWPDRMLHESFRGWERANPVPRDKASTARWTRFGMESGTTLIQELHPLAIVVSGNTAVAHYVYSEVTEDSGGERDSGNGRYTDVLVRTGDGWRFLAWHGGEDPENDG